MVKCKIVTFLRPSNRICELSSVFEEIVASWHVNSTCFVLWSLGCSNKLNLALPTSCDINLKRSVFSDLAWFYQRVKQFEPAKTEMKCRIRIDRTCERTPNSRSTTELKIVNMTCTPCFYFTFDFTELVEKMSWHRVDIANGFLTWCLRIYGITNMWITQQWVSTQLIYSHV